MSLFGILEKAAEAVGGPVVTAAVEGGKALGSFFGGSQTIAGQATMSPEALVKMITQGAGPQGLEGEQQDNTAKAQVQNQIETDTRRHMTTMESAWTGAGADAARDKLQAATQPVAASSQAMTTNANTISGQVNSFTTLKNSLHTDVTDSPPQKSMWDTLTPWDTSTEDAINANNAKVQENLQAYHTYAQNAQASAPQLKTDYGQVTDLSGGSFQLQPQPPLPPDKPGQGPGDPSSVIGGTNNRRSSSTTVPSTTSTSRGRNDTAIGQDMNSHNMLQNIKPVSSNIKPVSTKDNGNISGSLDDTTDTAGYTSPGGSSYRPSTFGSSYNPSGSGVSSDFSAGGFGPVGGGFGPIGGGSGGSAGGTGGYGSGGASTGGGALTGGKATGGGMAAEAGAAGAAAKAGAPGASGAAGRGGMSGMGGAHGGKGQGGEDSEHQRPSYLIEEDPDGLFGTDEKTAPPVIGL